MRPSRFLAGLPAAPEGAGGGGGAEGSPALVVPHSIIKPFSSVASGCGCLDKLGFHIVCDPSLGPTADRSHVIITSNYFIGTKIFFVERDFAFLFPFGSDSILIKG